MNALRHALQVIKVIFQVFRFVWVAAKAIVSVKKYYWVAINTITWHLRQFAVNVAFELNCDYLNPSNKSISLRVNAWVYKRIKLMRSKFNQWYVISCNRMRSYNEINYRSSRD